jgi:hypothetical protein
MSTAVSKTPRARDDNDYDAPPNIRNVNPLRGAPGPWKANCKYCGKEVGGIRKRAVVHDIKEHQRKCIFR